MSVPNLTSPRDGLHIVEDFFSNDAVADATLGQLGWEIVTIANASTFAFQTAQTHGVLRSTTSSTAQGAGAALRLFTDALVLNGGDGGFFAFRAKYPTVTGNILATNNFRIGLDDSVTATSPTVGIWVDSAAGVITLQADSADGGDLSTAAAGVSTLTSGTTMVIDTWHDFMVTWEGTNSVGGPKDVHLFIDGELAATVRGCLIDNDEEMECKIVHWQTASGGDTLELDLDYYELFIPR